MTKWWISGFFTVLIVLFTSVVWWEQKSGGACYEQNAAQRAEDFSAPPPLVVNGLPREQSAPQEANKPTPNSESYLCSVIGPTNLPADYLVIIGIGGVFVAIFTLKSIHHQAVQVKKQTKHIARQALSMRRQTSILRSSVRAARRGAQAALLNAQAVMNSERAWLIAELVPTALMVNGRRLVPVDNQTGELSEDDLSDGHQFEYQLKITNMGKTPAFITKFTIRRSDGIDDGELMDFHLPYRSLEGGAKRYVYTLDVTKEVGHYPDADHVFFFGNITYKHVFSNKKTIREPYGYVFYRKTGLLERMPNTEDYTAKNPD